jgi:glycosyltransferase involved in cell wall biosynthesis
VTVPRTAAGGTPDLAVVVPAYNEQDVLPLFAARLRATCDELALSYEVIVVDDGSTDETAAVLALLAATWPQLRSVRLRANVGHQNALTAGLEQSSAHLIVSIDADLQDPPEVIARMVDAAGSGVQVVYARRSDRATDSLGKRWTASLYYRAIRRLTGVDLPPHAGDFRLLSRAALDEISTTPRNDRVYRLLVPSLGLSSAQVPYARDARAAGTSKYPLRKMVRLAYDSLISFSVRPLTIAMGCGVLAGALCLALMAWALLDRLDSHTVPGWTSVSMAVLGVGAAQLVCTGLIGEYVARLVRGMTARPPYLIESVTTAVDDESAAARTIVP